MTRRFALVALALVLLTSRTARADDAAASAPPPVTVSPKRPVPDYEGRPPPGARPGDVALWIPRVLLSPVYFVSEYVLRRPLAAVIPAAERIELPRKVYDFFTFGPEHKIGFAPIGLVEFNFNPSVGVYAFWDDAGFKGDHLRLHVEAWPDEWLAGSVTQRMVLDDERTLQLRASGLRRPDKVFYGTGPESLQAHESRYGLERFDAGAAYDWRFWRSSLIETMAGVRDVRTYDGHYGGEPTVTQGSASGAFSLPDGFGRQYTAEYNRILAAVDTRAHLSPRGSGLRLELGGEQGSDLRSSPASGWLRYGATAAGYVDLNGYGRILGLSVTTMFVDPLGPGSVPFTELVYLGGDHPMAGYYDGRMRDRSAAVATASYSWPIGPWLDGRLEAAVGNVFGAHLAGFDGGLLRFSGAFGLSVAGLQDAPVELLVGLGSETFDQGGQIDSVRVSLGVPHTF